MEKISWRDRVGNEEVSNTVKEERNILRTVKRRNDNWIVDVLRSNRLLKHIVEGKTEWKRRYKQLLDNLKEKTGYGNLKTKTSHSVDNSIWKRLRTCRKRDYEIN